MSIEDEKYKKLRESLRVLPRIKARKDFDARLHRRLLEHDSSGFKPQQKEARGSSWIDMLANLFKPSLAPAIGLTVVLLAVIVVYFAYYNELNKDKQQLLETSGEQKRDEFIIYVKNDGERIQDETAKDIVSADTKQPSTIYSSPTEHVRSSDVDMFEQPDIGTERKLKEDRISDEQKLEMERESIESKKEDTKISPKKEDDGIYLKKSGKLDKSKEAPSNIRDEVEIDTGNKLNGVLNEQKADEEMNQKAEDTIKDNEKERLVRSRKDSLKVKDKDIEEQKDSIDK